MAKKFRFDKAYYDRFYGNRSTRVTDQKEMTRLVRYVASYLIHIGQPVRSVLDLGCGIGAWREPLRRHFRNLTYTGVEVSDYMCENYGWQHGSVVDFEAEPADLVICHGVLQYLGDTAAGKAIANLAALCGGALFLEVLTAEDWEQNCDRSITDGDVILRPAKWYRRELAKHFTNCGGGMFLSPCSVAVLYELEKAE